MRRWLPLLFLALPLAALPLLARKKPALTPSSPEQPKPLPWARTADLSLPAPRVKHDHWAFQPIGQPNVPDVANRCWARTPIDTFILARLEKEGLVPAPEAARETLIRRVSLDLRGLPPALDELEAALRDPSPHWYENLVERFLASPHYGEHWARFWLDAARYADSDGYQTDQDRSIWRYRDWVVQALNDDLPYDEFVTAQLAGDLLPQATREQKTATGFLRNCPHNREAGVDAEQTRFDRVADWTNTTATVFLGLTLECAQCHTHKYDPISQKEYYEFFAFFNAAREIELPLPTPATREATAGIDQRVAQLEKQQASRGEERQRLVRRFFAEQVRAAPRWQTLAPIRVRSSEPASRFEVLQDHSVRVGGEPAAAETYTFDVETTGVIVTGFRLELIPDSTLPHGGVGRAEDGAWELAEIEILVAANDGRPVPVKIAAAEAIGHDQDSPVSLAIDGDDNTAWAGVSTRTEPAQVQVPRVVSFRLANPMTAKGGLRWTVKLHQKLSATLSVGRFRLAVTTAADPVAVPAGVEELSSTNWAELTPSQHKLLDEVLAARWRQEAAVLRASRPLPQTTLALEQDPKPRATHVHRRGEFDAPAERVRPGVPAVLPGLASEGSTRLDLAGWLTSPQHPLLTRVLVNRVWQRYFGGGLVETENDFGTRGRPPTHAELLDWLCRDFMTHDWSLKELHRRIVLSATYRQSAAPSASAREADPENKLLARQRPLPLEAEVVRDSALAVSGKLSPKLHGPSVFPYQPKEVLDQSWFKWSWKTSPGEDQYRRTLYTFIRRSTPHPLFQILDGADPVKPCTRRSTSTTPLQALLLLNDPAFLELTRACAGRVLREGGSDDAERVRFVFRLCLARTPESAEQGRALEFLMTERRAFAANPRAARDFVGGDTGTNRVELAAWAALCRVLFNLDEFLTRP